MKKLLLLIFALPLFTSAQTTIFSQNFNGSSVVSDYVNASTPSSSQFNAIGTTGSGVVFDINSGKLRYARTTTSVGTFSRTSDFSPTPDVVVYKIDLQISGNSTATTTTAVFQVGSGFGTANSAEGNSLVHSRFGINFTANVGEFTLRDIGAGTNSAAFTGNQTITWVINNSTNTFSYTPPSGTGTETLATDTWDLFIGTTKVFDDKAATTGSQSLTDLKFAFTAGTGTIELDNIDIQSIDVIPPTFTALYPKSDNVNGTSFDLISNINETGTTYYVVLPDGATAPTSAQVAAGNDASNTAAGFSGSAANALANTDYVRSITGLTLNTAYDVYVVAKDAANNFQTSPVKLDVATLGTLPITLSYFKAKPVNKNILLNWQTLSEKNNKYFELQRSADGKSYQSFVTVSAVGNSDLKTNYSFTDQNPSQGTNYYKLLQYDFDGNSSFKVIAVDALLEEVKVSVSTSTSTVDLSIVSPNSTSAKLALYSIEGKKVAEQSASLIKGVNALSFNEALKPGVYFVSLVTESGTVNTKFIK